MSEINVTPFVDVMLVLLIIFMVTAPLLTVGVQVDLPESSADSLPEETEPLTLIVFNLDSKPTPSKLYNILFNNGFKVRWSRNNDNDFQSYKLYKSNLPDMSNKVLMFETNEINDTTEDVKNF